MNLFLGNYRVRKDAGPALWELPGDHHLHNITDPDLMKVRRSYTRWWTPEFLLPQEEQAKMSFLGYDDYEFDHFRIHDAKYDNYDGPYEYEYEDGDYDNSDEEQEDQSGDPSLNQPGKDDNHIENLKSEDEDDCNGKNIKMLATNGRVDSMDSVSSYQSTRSQGAVNESESRRSSINPTKVSAAHSISSFQPEAKDGLKQNRLQNPESGMRTSHSNTNILPSSHIDSIRTSAGTPKSEYEHSLDENMIDFKERIVAPLNLGKESQPN